MGEWFGVDVGLLAGYRLAVDRDLVLKRSRFELHACLVRCGGVMDE